jgi:hypothetical protein
VILCADFICTGEREKTKNHQKPPKKKIEKRRKKEVYILIFSGYTIAFASIIIIEPPLNFFLCVEETLN